MSSSDAVLIAPDSPETAPAAVETVLSGPSFAELGMHPAVVTALAKGGITHPTPVQAAVVPDALAGHDVLGRAQTGSGKTLAFGLPILARLAGQKSRPKQPRALVVVPTRELATQVRRSLEPLAFAAGLRLTTVYGGSPYDRQIKQLRAGVDIVVATPGRLQDLIDKGHCRTDDIAITVLDEADHLCDLGFYPAVDALLNQIPAGGQRMLLSATLDGDVDRLVRKHLRDPRLHQLDPAAGAVTTMEHHVMVVGGFRDKISAATALVEANERSIVFTRTREGATELAGALTDAGIESVDLHGNLSQRVRERNLHKFSSGRARVVVATDVAARGIHVDNVGLVVHFDAPNDPKAYLHRSGRTARAGESGTVVTITTPKQVDEIIRMQSRAGVESRHHDIRSTPRPMTAATLASSGEVAPRAGSGRSAGARRPSGAGYQGRRTERPAYSRGGAAGGSSRGAGAASGRRSGGWSEARSSSTRSGGGRSSWSA
ncbi:DEAD/DEAH box helicase [Nocardioides mesophilus]|uniref:DEAD/DEAH box helicase n=1 Tax=Nocardioides mesophilus TaxID=433659 RepID=UPI001CB71ADB|nr:DEAD/DEAH box helicase [Nocardioides mesophilus]